MFMMSDDKNGGISSGKEEVADETKVKKHRWCLENIPPELFLLICSFLSARFVIKTLSQVNKRFYNIINEYTTWKYRITRRWPKKYPPVSVPDEMFDWKEACIQREEQYKLWSDWETNMYSSTITGAHYAAVDVVHFLEGRTLFVSGSRDHSLKLWDVNKYDLTQASSDFSSCIAELKVDAHAGWVWSLCSSEQHLYSGGWDANIKMWDMKTGFNNVNVVSCSSAVLCLDYANSLLSAGTYGRQVLLIDVRTSDIVMSHSNHKKAVLCITMDENFIITGSEDDTLMVFDKRNGRLLVTQKFQGFPLSLSYGYNHLWVGDKQGVIHLMDPVNNEFQLVESYQVGHVGKITGICHSLGSVITCSTDKTIRISEPNADPEVVAQLSVSGEVAGIASYENMLVSANSDCSICIWLPKEE